ncbi:MAG: DUF885 domain-containing protein [bacterium]
MKKFFKWTAKGLLVAIVLFAIFVAQAIWFRPLSINVFYNKIFLEFALENPEMLSSMRLLEPIGFTSHNGKLDNASPEHELKMAQMSEKNLEQLHEYDRDSLSQSEQLSYDVLDYFLSNQVESNQFLHYNYPVNQLFGIQNNYPSFMATDHQVDNEEAAKHYLMRLDAVGPQFDQVIESLKLRTGEHIIPPQFVFEKVLKEMRDFVATPAKENILYTSFSKKLDALNTLDNTQKAYFENQAEQRINNSVYPAYQKLIDYMAKTADLANGNNGVWSLPNGDAFYAMQVRHHTTTNLTPEQIHTTGLAEVDRIEKEMDGILTNEGYSEGSIGERMTTIAHESRFLYPNTDESKQQILDDYQSIIDDMDASLDAYFDIRPKIGVEVRRIPEFKEKTAPGAYYNGPAMDGSRPGIFYANLRNTAEIPTYGMKTLAYHEAIPGHHFQIAIAQELTDLPIFRRMLPFTAYAEGWALYAERLAWELGKEEDPYENLGRLQAEMFRAVRLVVDTGLHNKRWTREQAIDYMIEKTGMGKDEVVSEIERYLVMPGQALAYKTGMLKLLFLRKKVRDALGDKFDIREFHNVVLSQGSLPLTLLEQQVDQYIAATK